MMKDDSDAVRALVAELQQLCAKLPASEEYVMVHHPAFRVGKKPFAIAGMRHNSNGATLSVNLGRDAQSGLLDDPRFSKTPYIGQHGWVTITREAMKKGELGALVTASWQRIANAKQRAALAGASRPSPPKKPGKK